MAYSHTTLAQAADSLAQRLGDPTKRFWIDAELRSYVTEALRTWQVFSVAFTKRVSIPTSSGTRFYNLFSSLVPDLNFSVTDREVIRDVQRALQEPISGTSWIGSEQFTFEDVIRSLRRRRDQFLLETGVVLTDFEVPGPTPPASSIELGNANIDVRRVAWKSTTNVFSLLWRADPFTLSGISQAWNLDPSTPENWTTAALKPITIQLSPPPIDSGSLSLLSVNNGQFLDPANSETVLGIPDDFAWVVKWGVLSDLLGKDGPGADPLRAAYSESRWREGVDLARISSFVRFGYINNKPRYISSLADFDANNPNWMNSALGTPDELFLAGNLVGTFPIADANPASINLDIMANFPINPDLPGTDLQVGQESLNVILQYAQHIATFKEGGDEFQFTLPFRENLVRLAATQNERLRASANNFDVLTDRSFQQAIRQPRRASDVDIEDLNYE